MAAFDFPASPGVGAIFIDPVSGASYTWNGYAWLGGTGNSLGALVVGDNPPGVPADNSLWFESDTGMLFLRYNDGNSSQWVQLNALPNGAGYMPLRGVVDGSDALAGQIGEVISANATSTAITINTPTSVVSIVLTPGDWDVSSEIWVQPTAAASQILTGINTSVALPAGPVPNFARSQIQLTTAGLSSGVSQMFALKTCRFSVTVSTTVYAVAQLNAAGIGAAGIWARRAR